MKMLKNKIIALLSVATMMFSFATIVSAEKTPIVTDPTFAVKYNKDNGDGTHSYYFGVSFPEETSPFTFKKTVINQDEVDSDGADPEYECSGIGLQCLEIILEANDASATITKVSGTKGISFTQDNLNINFTATAASDFNKLTSRGDNIWTKFTVTTNAYVEPTAFKCSKLTLAIKDAANFSNSWVYSSDPEMIEAKQADFLAYTKATGGEDTPTPTKVTKYAKLVAGDGSYVVIDLTNGETIKDTAKLFLPSGVKGGTADVGIKFSYTAGVAADGKVAPAVGDTFKLYHMKDTNADDKSNVIDTFIVE